ncbi:MAG: YIP1 family protein [bacterium]
MESNEMQKERVETPEMSAVQRVIGVFTSPAKTFASIAVKPSWLLPIIIYSVVNIVFIFFAREIIVSETLTQQEERMVERGMESGQIEQALSTTENVMKYTMPIFGVIVPIILILLVSAVFLFVGNVIMGGKASFKSIFSATAHSFLIGSLGALIMLPLILAKDTMQVSFSLASLMSEEARKTFLYQLLLKVDIFWIWWIAVYSIGLAMIYKMKTQKMATAVVTVYAIYAVIASALSGLFS